jgi:hypothetical protein
LYLWEISINMTAYPLVQTDLEELLHSEDAWSWLPVRLRDFNVTLCLNRAYAAFNQPAPKPTSSAKMYIPFALFRKEENVVMKPAAGVPYRLLQNYQCKLPDNISTNCERIDFQRLSPECVLETTLNQLDRMFTDYPSETTAQIVYIPFYIIKLCKGSTSTNVLVNGYNADVLLEQPPPKKTRSDGFGRTFMAVSAYAGLVALITGVWLTMNSFSLSIALTIVAAAGIRKVVEWRLALR